MLTLQPHQVSSSLSTSASLRGSQATLADSGLSTESLLQAKRLGMASLDMARYLPISQSILNPVVLQVQVYARSCPGR